MGNPALWVGFIAFVFAMLALDLGVFHKKAHAVGLREALTWSGVWIGLALLFNAAIWWRFGPVPAVEFLPAWLVEKSLSIDNVFVFLAIFSTLAIPAVHQHRVLFWGILSALGLRAAMIFAGTAALARFEWLVYVFGAFLVLTGVKLFVHRDQKPRPAGASVGRWLGRFAPAAETPSEPERSALEGGRFFTVKNGARVGTPLLSALVLIELSDVVFAVDSIPVVLGITADPFIVFTSNVFAMLGLRSMFFAIAGAAQRFVYLKAGLAAVLVFVGAKMALVDLIEITPLASLLVIAALLATSIGASLLVRPPGIAGRIRSAFRWPPTPNRRPALPRPAPAGTASRGG